VPFPERQLQTAWLAARRVLLTAIWLFSSCSGYFWLAGEVTSSQGSFSGVYALWAASAAPVFGAVTLFERKLGPPRARHVALLGLTGLAFAFLWGVQYSHLDALAQGKTPAEVWAQLWRQLRGYGETWGQVFHVVAWAGTFALPLVVLAGLRRARWHLIAQISLPCLLALSLDLALRRYDIARAGIPHRVNLWSFSTALPKGLACLGYALVAAWDERGIELRSLCRST